MEEENKPPPFQFAISAERATPEILQMLMHLRASVDALAVLLCETIAQVSQTSGKEAAERYEKLKAEFVLHYAFLLHESAGTQNPERKNRS